MAISTERIDEQAGVNREIKVVLLDADGVLQTSGEEFLSSVAALCVNPDQRNAFVEDVFLAEKPCLTGNVDFPAALGEVLAKWKIDTPTSDALGLWNQIQPVSEILDAISSLRAQGIRVCLATNQQEHRATIMADGLGYSRVFDDLFFSCRLGVAKPNVDFFKEILNRLDISGERVLFIDDHAKNVLGAKDAGVAAEVYHVSGGFDQFISILERYNLPVG
jgi:putative hydrolase of the HAD superfamily